MMAPNDASSAPKTLLHRPSVIAARKKITPSKMSCSSRPCFFIFFLSDTYGGRTHDKPIADATPYPLQAGSRSPGSGLLGVYAPPGGDPHADEETPRPEADAGAARANQALHHRRLRIEHVNSSVKRCRIVKDRIRLWKEGVRDLVMELCCTLHNFRVRLTPWQPMV